MIKKGEASYNAKSRTSLAVIRHLVDRIGQGLRDTQSGPLDLHTQNNENWTYKLFCQNPIDTLYFSFLFFSNIED